VELAATCPDEEFSSVEGLPALWAELRWAARQEGVIHLDDLLLRRTRLGLTTPQGGANLMGRIRAICQPELGWGDDLWTSETECYLTLWRECYSVPK
jgi:glycerol-3-phosphate dehydrogenase